jgi:transcriptional regulator with XRE-family HTH domain
MTQDQEASAQLQRRQLRGELRRARSDRQFTQKEVAEAMDWSVSKLVRIENGSVGISTSDLEGLLRHYGIVEDDEVNRFVQMARGTKQEREWWDDYRSSTSQQYVSFVAYENSASVIQQFEPMLIPGLLQQEAYARAVLQELAGSASKQRVDDWVELRLRRQEKLFGRSDPPEMLFILGESCLRPWIGGSEVMRRQLRWLQDAALKDNVTIEVIPFSAGAHPGMKGPFVILQFADELIEDVLFLENSRGDMITRDVKDEIDPYREVLGRLRELATQDIDTRIDEALHHIK